MRMRRMRHFDRRKEAVTGLVTKCEIHDKNFNNHGDDEYIDLSALFGNDNPVYLEIGSGLGAFAIEFGRRHPEYNLLAVELSENVIIKAAERTAAAGVTNVRYLCVSANYLLRFIRPDTVYGLFLNFSTPFPKNRHESHRLTAPIFLDIYKSLLKDGAKIIQKTDNMHFFEYSLVKFSECGFVLEDVSLDLHSCDDEDNIMTEYERKFVEKGMPIYRAKVRK